MIHFFILLRSAANINYKFFKPVFLGALMASCFATQAHGQETAEQPPEIVYDDIPANWDYYNVTAELLEKYKGEAIKEICLDDDIANNTMNFEELRISGKTKHTSNLNRNHKNLSRVGKAQNFGIEKSKLLTGARDFIVVGEKHVVIRTPETGTSLVEMKYCKKELRRAKYLMIPNRRTKRCFKDNKGLSILTRYKSGFDICDIESIHSWTGPMDLLVLKQESDEMVSVIDTETLIESEK